MDVNRRVELLNNLGQYMLSGDEEWQQVKKTASLQNPWFTPEFIELATRHIANAYLQPHLLQTAVRDYAIPANNQHPASVGIVMAGNIPLVGFHDFLCVFLSGHRAMIKPSAKDDVLIDHLVRKMQQADESVASFAATRERLNECNAFIATGSNNSSRYFEYYFGRFPNIIRSNRTSVAVLTGDENREALDALADDVHRYFGLGCRNVTKIYVPRGYDFSPLLDAFKKYDYLSDHHKFKNNYDYQLAVLIINRQLYMTNGTIILFEDPSIFSPISRVNYEFYTSVDHAIESINAATGIQCVVGDGFLPFGQAQQPGLTDFADGVDTLQFLLAL